MRAAAAFAALLVAGAARGETREIDAKASTLTVHVGKSGVFSGFGDTHEVRAPIAAGRVEIGPPASVSFTVNAKGMTVLDPQLSPQKRADVQKTMLSPEVLDVEEHPEIRFRSTEVRDEGGGRWRVAGTLEIRGKGAPVTFEARVEGEHVRGEAEIRQTAFGIKPVSVAAGTVKVRDELKISFDVVVPAR